MGPQRHGDDRGVPEPDQEDATVAAEEEPMESESVGGTQKEPRRGSDPVRSGLGSTRGERPIDERGDREDGDRGESEGPSEPPAGPQDDPHRDSGMDAGTAGAQMDGPASDTKSVAAVVLGRLVV